MKRVPLYLPLCAAAVFIGGAVFVNCTDPAPDENVSWATRVDVPFSFDTTIRERLPRELRDEIRKLTAEIPAYDEIVRYCDPASDEYINVAEIKDSITSIVTDSVTSYVRDSVDAALLRMISSGEFAEKWPDRTVDDAGAISDSIVDHTVAGINIDSLIVDGIITEFGLEGGEGELLVREVLENNLDPCRDDIPVGILENHTDFDLGTETFVIDVPMAGVNVDSAVADTGTMNWLRKFDDWRVGYDITLATAPPFTVSMYALLVPAGDSAMLHSMDRRKLLDYIVGDSTKRYADSLAEKYGHVNMLWDARNGRPGVTLKDGAAISVSANYGDEINNALNKLVFNDWKFTWRWVMALEEFNIGTIQEIVDLDRMTIPVDIRARFSISVVNSMDKLFDL